MKKHKGLAYAVLGILFVLFNVIAFVIPTAKTPTFWTAYSFTVIAFAAQAVIWTVALKKADTPKSRFLGLPIIHVGVIYLIVQLIAFAVFTAKPLLPSWTAAVVCALVLGISAVCLIGTNIGREEIRRVEEKVSKKVFYIKALQVDIEMLAEQESDTDTKAALLNLAECVRFSDPMSHNELSELEAEISSKVRELKTAENKSALITELNSLLTERNKKAKLLK